MSFLLVLEHSLLDYWLVHICADALIHSHFTLKVNDELKDLVPQVRYWPCVTIQHKTP